MEATFMKTLSYHFLLSILISCATAITAGPHFVVPQSASEKLGIGTLQKNRINARTFTSHINQFSTVADPKKIMIFGTSATLGTGALYLAYLNHSLATSHAQQAALLAARSTSPLFSVQSTSAQLAKEFSHLAAQESAEALKYAMIGGAGLAIAAGIGGYAAYKYMQQNQVAQNTETDSTNAQKKHIPYEINPFDEYQ